MSAQDVVAVIAPQYVADSRLTDAITIASAQCDSTFFGSRYDMAVAYLACHFLAIGDRGNAGATSGGAITSEKEGQLSRAYGALSGNSSDADNYYNATIYGSQYLTILRSVSFNPINRMV